MFEDGRRLSYFRQGKYISVTDTINNELFVCDNGFAAVKTLDADVIFNHIKTIEELINSKQMSWIGLNVPKHDYRMRGVQVIEEAHFKYVFVVDGRYAELTETSFRGQCQFNKSKLLTALHFIYDQIAKAKTPLQPQQNVIRRFPDIKVCAWVYGGHILLVSENNIDGGLMKNCLLDDKYYPLLNIMCVRQNGVEEVRIADEHATVYFSCPMGPAFVRYFGDVVEVVDFDKIAEEVTDK